ncbi:MAG: glutamine--fructose-6-phosphate transaminase (isomerizing) [Verrucomicrobiota bacterium]|nr:glutamine--fructose-6-phosphate transaminase (isomerizing) [Verrucomicrobiota bacterium]
MCGIIGYIGSRKTEEVLLDVLHKLEYRGYDSAGLSVIDKNKFNILKVSGKVNGLARLVNQEKSKKKFLSESGTGIAHTRWATHGAPTIENAHPHMDSTGQFIIVHNGIIENYASLKQHLKEKGRKCISETDSEVLVNLIAESYEDNLENAVVAALKKVQGTYGIIVQCLNEPKKLVVARLGSPIILGLGEKETLICSDPSAILSYTRKVMFLDDEDIAIITPENIETKNIQNVSVTREVSKIDWEPQAIQKSGYEHFMLKEIFEQPQTLKNTIRGRLDENRGTSVLSGLNTQPRELADIERIILAACGTSMLAGMVGEYYFEDLCDIPTEVEQAAEFRYRNPIVNSRTLAIAVSQSGETADTLAAVKEAKQKGAQVCGICNVIGSTIARECEKGIYLHAGPEIGVASTKAFTSQVTVLLMMALRLGRSHRLSRNVGVELVNSIKGIPKKVQEVLQTASAIEDVAKKYAHINNAFFIGRNYLYPVALEGALKLKEISYIHAEGYHAAELKHGPIALLDENVPVIALANNISGKEKIIGNINECRARKAPVIITATKGDDELRDIADDILWIPSVSEYITPILTAVALQLFAYYVAKERGCSIDQPRNLAKSVTVE